MTETPIKAARPHRILLTGAAGRIGTSFYDYSREGFTFRLADITAGQMPDTVRDGDEILRLDVADPDACQAACHGIDTVVHLAASPSPESGFYESLLDNNIKGTYNIFRAAADQGCQRVVFASSIHTVWGYPPDTQTNPDTPVRPLNMYGVSKCFGEAVASCFAYSEGLSSIAVRIASYDADWFRNDLTPQNLSQYVSHSDLNQLLLLCITTPDIQFAIVNGVSNNRFKRMDLTSTRQLLGYEPEDDAFELFETSFK
jgi:nucleoside-diphosphate-sugar epimerase